MWGLGLAHHLPLQLRQVTFLEVFWVYVRSFPELLFLTHAFLSAASIRNLQVHEI